jgi:predicted ATP-dependent Lon-type protease
VRDRNAIELLAAGYLKLLFPELQLSHDELVEYCLRPAASLRQTVRAQLAELDPEYSLTRSVNSGKNPLAHLLEKIPRSLSSVLTN